MPILRCQRRRRCALMQAKQRGSALRSRAPRRFGCQRGGCGRIPLQRTSPRRKIAPNHRESGECRIESLWEFSLNSQLAVVEVVLIDLLAFASISIATAVRRPAPSVFGGGASQTQLTVRPPSTTSSVPVMYLASSDARKRGGYATAQGSPM